MQRRNPNKGEWFWMVAGIAGTLVLLNLIGRQAMISEEQQCKNNGGWWGCNQAGPIRIGDICIPTCNYGPPMY